MRRPPHRRRHPAQQRLTLLLAGPALAQRRHAPLVHSSRTWDFPYVDFPYVDCGASAPLSPASLGSLRLRLAGALTHGRTKGRNPVACIQISLTTDFSRRVGGDSPLSQTHHSPFPSVPPVNSSTDFGFNMNRHKCHSLSATREILPPLPSSCPSCESSPKTPHRTRPAPLCPLRPPRLHGGTLSAHLTTSAKTTPPSPPPRAPHNLSPARKHRTHDSLPKSAATRPAPSSPRDSS